jgi:hypothetical protein
MSPHPLLSRRQLGALDTGSIVAAGLGKAQAAAKPI